MTGERQHIVVMGVSGCGKTTVGEQLAAALGWSFAEGDRYHPQANIDKMAAGIPLTDEDRWPWLRILADRIGAEERAGRSSVLTCSSLRRSYRDLLRSGGGRVRFVHLYGTREVLASRLGARTGHFFPSDLLELAACHAGAAGRGRGRHRGGRGSRHRDAGSREPAPSRAGLTFGELPTGASVVSTWVMR